MARCPRVGDNLGPRAFHGLSTEHPLLEAARRSYLPSLAWRALKSCIHTVGGQCHFCTRLGWTSPETVSPCQLAGREIFGQPELARTRSIESIGV